MDPFQPAPKYSFGNSKKITTYLLLPSVSKGPGAYTIPEPRSTKALNFGQYSQRKFVTDSSTPGPMTYTPHFMTSRSGVSFSHNYKTPIRHVHRVQDSLPGPGSYNVESEHSKIGGIINKNQKAKSKLINDNKFPGVGAYDPKPIKSSKGFQFHPERIGKRSRHIHTPSPGSYSLENHHKTPCVRIVTAKRTWSYISGSDTPGPGSYSFAEQKVQKNKPKKATVSRSKTETKQTFFSPDDLNRLKEYGKLKLTFTKQPRREEFLDEFNSNQPNKINRSPGPAMYQNINFKPKATGVGKFGSGKKQETFIPKEGPGVGSYKQESTLGKFYKKPVKKQIIKFRFSLDSLE